MSHPAPGQRRPGATPGASRRQAWDDLRLAAEMAASAALFTARQTGRVLLSRRGAAGAAVEAAWLGMHVATYPVGLSRERSREVQRYRVSHLPPHQRGLFERDVEAAGTPILLVHGMIDNRSVFTRLQRSLRQRGFDRVRALNYSPATNDVREAARGLAVAVEAVVADTGYERIHVIGHSLGGLIARYYVQRLGGDERVHTLVTLGTPHAGSWHAWLLPVTLCRQLRPGSELFAELGSPAPHCRTRFISYWSDLDQVVLPHEAARLVHPDLSARNVPVSGVGHMSLPIQGWVVREIGDALSQLDPDGHTVEQGVTALAGQSRSGRRRRAD